MEGARKVREEEGHYKRCWAKSTQEFLEAC